MDTYFREYFERYTESPEKYVYISISCMIIIGKIPEKTDIKGDYTNKLEIIDMIDKFNIFDRNCEHRIFKKGELWESTNSTRFYDNYEDAFYHDMRIEYTWESSIIWSCSYKTLERKTIPNDITYINYNMSNHHIPFDKLPKDLERINFGYHFNGDTDGLPKKLVTIEFGDKFNKPLGKLPVGVKHIKFGVNYNQPLINVPENLETIEFGVSFDQSINMLPDSVEKIVFNGWYRKKVRRWPKSLTHITLRRKKCTLVKKIPAGVNITFIYPINLE